MLPVLSAAQMRAADRATIDDVGLPGAVLMENAGAAVAALIDARWPALRPYVLCGKGNNGGDGFVVARRLLARAPRVLLFGSADDVQGDARLHLQALLRSGGTLETVASESEWRARRDEVAAAELIVDALLGTGLRAAPSGLVALVIADLAARRGARPVVVAVDLPSGVDADSGALRWPCLRADETVTFAALKPAHVLPPACDAAGRVHVADIGIPAALGTESARLWQIEARDAAAAFPPRARASHKGSYGHVLVLAGSVGKSGAAALAATAALRAGAGLVTVALPAPALPLLVSQVTPEVMTVPLPSSAHGAWTREALATALELSATRQAVVLGPGIGTDTETAEFVQAFVPRCPVPLVLDAGALSGLAAAGAQGPALVRERNATSVLTPHPGEMGQLTGLSSADVQARRLELACELADACRALLVLKGQRTLVAEPGGRVAVNPTGNPGLATAGTGDVLAGLLGALLGRGGAAWDAACAAVYLHGLAGDCAAARVGQEALLAGDLLCDLPTVLARLGVVRA